MIYKVKRRYYKTLLEDNSPDAIYILGGGDSINHNVKKRTIKGLITLFYKGSNPNLISGIEARVYAAVELSTYFPETKVVAMSHTTEIKSGKMLKIHLPTLAEKIALNLNKKGIPFERILQCKRSTSTLTELMEMIKLNSTNAWKTVVVITNEYHIERSRLLFYLLTTAKKQTYLFNSCYDVLKNDDDKELFKKEWHTLIHALEVSQNRGTQVFFISAEEILPERYIFYEKVIDAVHTSQAYKNREELEEKGIHMILRGLYNFDQNRTLESYLHYKDS